jgi:hypothetical protein
MYRFAYLYVKLGYLIAGIVVGVSLLFTGISIVVLEFQKLRQSAESYNREFARLQDKIAAQANSVQRVFGLDPSLPSLASLQARQWNASLVSTSSAARLERELAATKADVESLRQAVVSRLEADVNFITGQLAAHQKDSPNQRTASPSSSPSVLTSFSGDGSSLQEIYARTNSLTFPLRAMVCDKALDLVRTLQVEAKSTDNKAALGRAGGELEKFLQVIRNQQTLLEQAEVASVPMPKETSVLEPAAQERPTRKDNIREDLAEMLNRVLAAVTTEWNLDLTVKAMDSETTMFARQAQASSEQSDGKLNLQFALVGGFLLVVVLAFFIAVGSDLVKAILDSAVWLFHIYTNTSAPGGGGTNEPPQA